ncbi:hypothetical protein R6L23_23125 [Streptomyces sp. SR27]|uniref:hypothetical protein n=1 Tax=Streptomyces sp. SR27 TaxID=3076630 RepID=UPI00295C2B3F|nr:hypothetical protein [Streptomyces sp. SR27]MDV9191065.1 hypothetical protein [Streptomyces sp. SR27]
MTAAVLALGIGAATASGCVWYIPAITDIRAGADRPASLRTAAVACLTGWAAAALVVPLLLTSAHWALIGVVVGVGAAVSGALVIRGRAQYAREQREEARRWAALRHTPRAAASTRPGRAWVAWALAGLTAAPGAAVAVSLLAGR